MIPNQTHINYQKMLPMILLRQASNDDYRMSTLNILDDIMNFLDPEINFGLIEEIIVDDWIHNDPVLPNPELDRALWDMVKLLSKYEDDHLKGDT